MRGIVVALSTRLTAVFAVPFWLSGACAVFAFVLIGHQEPLAQGAPASADADEVHGKPFKTPAERLGLTGKPRARAENCLADAVYFESRGEALRGQKAVAQVVMNRVFSGRYPHDVCGVVFQNASHYLACQFTFACTGRRLNHSNEPRMWRRANRIAGDMLDGKIWLPEVGHATHYHAFWVRPLWVREMAKLYRFGVHTFYRPRAWGRGLDSQILSNVSIETKAAIVTAPKSAASADTKTTGIPDPKSTGAIESKPKGAPETNSSTTNIEIKPTEIKPTEIKPTETKSSETKSTEAKSTEAKSTEAKSTEIKPSAAAESKPKGTSESKSSVTSTASKATETAESKTKGTAESKSKAKAEGKSKVATAPKSARATEPKSSSATEHKPKGTSPSKTSKTNTESRSTAAVASKGIAEAKSVANADSKSKVASATKSAGASEPKSRSAAEQKHAAASSQKP
jgi:hypothetical protein